MVWPHGMTLLPLSRIWRASQHYGFNASEQIAQIQHLTLRTTVS